MIFYDAMRVFFLQVKDNMDGGGDEEEEQEIKEDDVDDFDEEKYMEGQHKTNNDDDEIMPPYDEATQKVIDGTSSFSVSNRLFIGLFALLIGSLLCSVLLVS